MFFFKGEILQNGNVGAEYDSKLQFREAKFVFTNQIRDSLFKTRRLFDSSYLTCLIQE